MSSQELRVNLTGNSSKLTSALSSASGKLDAFGSKMKSVGSSMTASLTLPLVAVAAAATKMAFDFDKSMGQIESLVGIAGDKVKQMGETAKTMAVNTGKSANEAAEALFFITSAGLRGADATDTLNMSLKASAIGLGETKQIADLATSAMNAYGVENMSASAATDIMVAAVREGKLEASELAGAMGGVIPIASNMGVSFDEVGAAMAAMSKTGTNAATGATQLTAILASIKKPTAEAEAAFNKMGLSTQDVQASLADQGLMSTLEMLQQGLQKTGQDTTAIFPNIRALKGVLDLTGKGIEDNKKVFDALSQSMGATDTAFEKTAQTASFKMTKGMNAMKESLHSVGQTILTSLAPTIEKLGNFFTSLSDKFKSLSPETQKLIIGFAAVVAAIGPILVVLGTLMTMAPAIGAAITMATGPVGLLVIALAAVAAVIAKNWTTIKAALVKVANYFIDLYNNALPVKLIVQALIMQFKNTLAAGKFVFKTLVTILKAFGSAAMGILGSLGDILMGIFTLDMGKIKSGFSGIGDALSSNLSKAFDEIGQHASDLGSDVAGNFNDALNAGKIDKIKLETETSETQTTEVETSATTDAPSTTPGSTDYTIKPAIDPEAAAKIAAVQQEINNALVTNDAAAYVARKDEATKYYDDLISKTTEGSAQEIALQQAKTATLGQLEADENARLLDVKQQILDATNASKEEQQALEKERIALHYEELRAMAEENGLMTAEMRAEFDEAEKEAQLAVYEEKKTMFMGFMMTMSEAETLMQGIGSQIDSAFGVIGNSITNAMGGAESAMGAFVGTLAKDAMKIIGHNLKVSMTNSITGASESAKSFGPAAAFVLPALIAGATALISSSFSKFAAGGIVSGPTMGLVGEYPGAKSNPEVIAPLNKLQGMLAENGGGGGGQVNVVGDVRLDGQDLLIAFERANETAERIY